MSDMTPSAENDAPMIMIIVHDLTPMTVSDLADLSCGHCRHRLTYHVTQDTGVTFCAVCHCLRSPGESILQPHQTRVLPPDKG